MIEAEKLDAAAVGAVASRLHDAERPDLHDEIARELIAAFLNALDDEAMDRAWSAFHADENTTGGTSHPRVPMRAALEAAVQEETG